MSFISVDFNGTEGTELSVYDSNFTKHTGATGNIEIANGRVRCSTTTASRYYHSTTPPSADYEVEAVLRFQSIESGHATSVQGRMVTGVNTRYGAQFATAAGEWSLFKTVNGTFTSLGTSSASLPSAGTSRPIKLKMVGSTIEMYIDGSGTPLISVSDTAITAAGKAGIGIAASSGGDSFGIHLDDFVATDLGTTRYWAIPTTAANGTIRTMVVLSDDMTSVLDSGEVTATGGFFQLAAANQGIALGTRHLATIHNWDENVNTTSIRGGTGIVEMAV